MALTPAANHKSSNHNSSSSTSTSTTPSQSQNSGQASPSLSTLTTHATSTSHVRPAPSPISNHSTDSSSRSNSNENSTLNSPSRFGLAGPPEPPRAISERHLAHADFRLDAIQNETDPKDGDERTSATSKDGEGISSMDTASVRNVDAPRAGFSSSRGNPVSAASIFSKVDSKSKGENSTIGSGRRGSNSSQTKRRGTSNATITPLNSQLGGDVADGGGNSSGSGGTALVVYGEDESETESESEATE